MTFLQISMLLIMALIAGPLGFCLALYRLKEIRYPLPAWIVAIILFPFQVAFMTAGSATPITTVGNAIFATFLLALVDLIAIGAMWTLMLAVLLLFRKLAGLWITLKDRSPKGTESCS